ncbi:AlbA family DNA-binding domain-containing protein, partial [Fretibacterium fastidiosum]
MEFDIGKFEEYREGNRLEVKGAKGGLPRSLWETYSSMANGYGGLILLGVSEKKDGSFVTTGLDAKDVEKLRRDLWSVLNDGKKVSVNLLVDEDVKDYKVGEDLVLSIRVPRAEREVRPVYINDDLFEGTFRRNGEGDYHCTRSEIKAMLRDQTEETFDMKVLENFEIDD